MKRDHEGQKRRRASKNQLEDRRNHVKRLRELGDIQPLLTATDSGKSVMERMNGFARVNDLESCIDPGDF